MQTTIPEQTTAPEPPATAAAGRSAAARQHRLWEQCCQFEAVFLSLMLKAMRRTVPEQGGVLPSSAGLRVTEEMFDEKMADQVGRTGRGGLAQVLYQTFLRAEQGRREAPEPELDESA